MERICDAFIIALCMYGSWVLLVWIRIVLNFFDVGLPILTKFHTVALFARVDIQKDDKMWNSSAAFALNCLRVSNRDLIFRAVWR
jgi:hypothetical protein